MKEEVKGIYDSSFYQNQMHESLTSAKQIVPILMDSFNPQSVVDVGCGVGTWLSVFMEHGIEDVQGIDGEYVDKQLLHIPSEKFLSHDLTKKMDTVNIRKFDLLLSLEVAEHIDASLADNYLDALTALSDIIIFSAAPPGQTGVGHVNEQWPDFWRMKFRNRGYECLDFIRPLIWEKIENAFWYSQNMIVYLKSDIRHQYNHLFSRDSFHCFSIVHPEMYLNKNHELSGVAAKLFHSKFYDFLIENENIGGLQFKYYAGRAYKENKQWEQAENCLNYYLKSSLSEYRLSAHYHLADIFIKKNDVERALMHINRCLSMTNGNHGGARALMAKLISVGDCDV